MTGIAILAGTKLFIDVIEGGPRAIVRGVIESIIPGSEFITIASSIDYIFNLSGSYSGTINRDNYDEYPEGTLSFINLKELEFALDKYDFPELARKKFSKMNKPKFKNRDFPTF